MKPPAKELYADDASNSSDSEVQKADMPREKRIMESKETGKKSKAADKTHENEVVDQSDIGSCSPDINKGLQVTKKNPHMSKNICFKGIRSVRCGRCNSWFGHLKRW